MRVFVTTYEAIGDGITIMETHCAAERDYVRRGMEIADRYKARGFRPRHYGPPATLMFEATDAPAGFKKIARDKPGVIECRPLKNTAIGKEAAKALETIGLMPSGEDAAQAFGWSLSQMAVDGSTIYFPTTMSLALPSARHFVRLPRFTGDGWEQPDTLTALPESEFMAALEQHNALARAANNTPAGAA